MLSFSPRTARPLGNRFTRATSIAAVAALGFVAACSPDKIGAPEMAPKHGLIGSVLTTVGGVVNSLLNVTGLLRNQTLSAPVTRSIVVDNRVGGDLRIDELGLHVRIPAGALPQSSMTISVTALPGQMIAYDFQPHGTKFLKPLTFEQTTNSTLLSSLFGASSLKGSYFKSVDQLDFKNNTAVVDEQFDAVVRNGVVSFSIPHFSGYMVSTGKSSASASPE